MDEIITLILYAIYVAIAYGLVGYISGALKTGEPLQLKRIAATVIYSIFVGFMGVYSGILNLENITFLTFDQLFAEYITILLVVNKIVDGIWEWYVRKSAMGVDVPCDFTISPATTTVGIPVTFTDVTALKLIRMWDFGDGTLSDDAPVSVHTFKKPGTYKVGAISIKNDMKGYHYDSIVITGDPTPAPVTPEKGYWAKIWESIVSFINAIFGK